MMTEWIAAHVFYASNSDPLLVECVKPLVSRLRRLGLVQRYFFIRYWLEGPHIRLRLLPAPGASVDTVRDELESAIDAFLTRRPALYEVDADETDGLYHRMFLAEYGEEKWNEAYGAEGRMPFRPNNSRHYIAYEPEYDRYGGPCGVELAEWHFEKSSDIVLHLLETANVHVRSVLLGLSFQLSVAMSLTLLENRHRVADFFDHYGRFWEANYAEGSDSWRQRYERSYQRMEATLTDRLALIEAAVADPTGAGVAPLERNWIIHCRELRDRMRTLANSGQLALRPRAGADIGEIADRPSATDPWGPVAVLLSAYVHMTNNRLGVSILDEVYLSHLAGRTIHGSTALNGRAA